MSLEILTQPTEEPVDVSEAKRHLRLAAGEDVQIALLIEAARERCEREIDRAIMSTEFRFTRRSWGGISIELPKPPLISVSEVKYIDTGEAEQTLTATTEYTADTTATPGRIWLVKGQSWPSISSDAAHPIQITYRGGYASANVVPSAIKQAIMLYVGHYYENREQVTVGGSGAELPKAATDLLAAFKWGNEVFV